VSRFDPEAGLRAAATATAAREHEQEAEERDSVAAMGALLLAAALVPTPIGAGPRYHPPAAAHGVCLAGPLRRASRVHVELFAHGRVVIVPAAVGLRRPRLVLGRVVAARCRMRVWTLDPSGVVFFDRAGTLGGLFAVWGRALAPTRLAVFRGTVRLYRNGVRVRADPRPVVLRDGDELVLEVGGYVPPHRSYRFPRH
jgi:hypothetical protein